MNKVMESWDGHQSSELLADWGPPQQVMNDGKGGEVWVYIETFTSSTPAHSDSRTEFVPTGSDGKGNTTGEYHTHTVYTPEQVQRYSKWRAFWVNTEGVIYSWQWQGL